MNTHTNVQIIEQGGKPAFAVLPYDEYLSLAEDKVYLPHEVVGMTAVNDYSAYKAWRIHLKMTQQEIADKVGITQSRVAKIEASPDNVSSKTRKNFADAMGINPKQLDLD